MKKSMLTNFSFETNKIPMKINFGKKVRNFNCLIFLLFIEK